VLEVAGDALRPVYRDGTMIVVSPTAAIRRGDRVVVKLRGGDVVVRELVRKTTKAIELRTLSLSPSERALANEDYLWIARIVWASQ
jgi:phage repressor protein C with HTH and peptisase S24 domain